MKRWMLHAALGLVLGATAAEASQPGSATPQALKVRLTVSEMPPTRTLCEVLVGSTTVVAEWDPSFDSRLSQTLTVPFKPDTDPTGQPEVSCWSRWHPADDAGNIAPHWVFVGDAETRLAAEAALLRIVAPELESTADPGMPDGLDVQQLQEDFEAAMERGARTSEAPNSSEREATTEAQPESIESRRRRAVAYAVRQQLTMPVALKTGASDTYSTTLSADWQCFTTPSDRDKTGFEACQYDGVPRHRPAVHVEVLSAQDAQRPLNELLLAFDAQTLGISDERSFFNPAPAAVVDTLSLLGDLALKRAQRRTRAFVAEQLGGDLCGEGVTIRPPWMTLTKSIELSDTIGYPRLGSDDRRALNSALSGLTKTFTTEVEVKSHTLTVKPEPITNLDFTRASTTISVSGVKDGTYEVELRVHPTTGAPTIVSVTGSKCGNTQNASCDTTAFPSSARTALLDGLQTPSEVDNPLDWIRPDALANLKGGANDAAFILVALYDPLQGQHRIVCPTAGVHPKPDQTEPLRLHAGPEGVRSWVDATCANVLDLTADPDSADALVHLERLGDTHGIAVLRRRISKKTLKGIATLDTSDPAIGDVTLRFPHTCALVEDRSFADFARSGPEIGEALATDLLDNALAAFTQFALDAPNTAPVIRDTIAPLVESTLPSVLEATRRGEAPSVATVQTMVASLRQSITDGEENATACEPARVWLAVGLGIVAECLEDGRCDPRTTAMKLAKPKEHFKDVKGVFGACAQGDAEIDKPLPLALRESLATLVNHLYGVFDPSSSPTTAQRAKAAVQATFASAVFGLDLAVHERPELAANADDRTALEATQDLLEGVQELALAGIDEDWARVAQRAHLVVPPLVRLIALDASCKTNDKTTASDSRSKCTRDLARLSLALERALPWASTLTAHSEQIALERSGTLTEDEVEASKETRAKALESLLESAGDRKTRHGEWVASLGAGVGFRAAHSWDRRGTALPLQPTSTVSPAGGRFIQTPITLPMGLSLQYLPTTHPMRARAGLKLKVREPLREALEDDGALRDGRAIGVGYHFQASAVDLGQFIIPSDDIRGVTWNEFLLAGVQAGIIVGTPRDAFVIAADYRYVPGDGANGAHQLGAVLTYYVPFLNLN